MVGCTFSFLKKVFFWNTLMHTAWVEWKETTRLHTIATLLHVVKKGCKSKVATGLSKSKCPSENEQLDGGDVIARGIKKEK